MRKPAHHAAQRGNGRSMFLQSSASGDDSARTVSRTVRVLIVDDVRDTVDTLLALLKHEGYEAIGVYDGAEVLRITRKFQPHAVILDIGMPGLSGYDLARALKAEHGEDCPVLIAVTAYAGQADKLMGRAAGFDYYFGKPVVIEELLSALSKAQQNH